MFHPPLQRKYIFFVYLFAKKSCFHVQNSDHHSSDLAGLQNPSSRKSLHKKKPLTKTLQWKIPSSKKSLQENTFLQNTFENEKPCLLMNFKQGAIPPSPDFGRSVRLKIVHNCINILVKFVNRPFLNHRYFAVRYFPVEVFSLEVFFYEGILRKAFSFEGIFVWRDFAAKPFWFANRRKNTILNVQLSKGLEVT